MDNNDIINELRKVKDSLKQNGYIVNGLIKSFEKLEMKTSVGVPCKYCGERLEYLNRVSKKFHCSKCNRKKDYVGF